MLHTGKPAGVFLCVYVDAMPAQICRGTPVHTPADQHSPEELQNKTKQNKTYSKGHIRHCIKDHFMNMRGD